MEALWNVHRGLGKAGVDLGAAVIKVEATAAQVNTATSQGQPAFLLQDIPPHSSASSLSLTSSGDRVYYGEKSDIPFVAVNTGVNELDYQGTPSNDQQQVPYKYQGSGGIPVGNFFSRLLFAWRFKDFNLLISSLIHGDSRMMIFRDINTRIPKPAPWRVSCEILKRLGSSYRSPMS